MDTQTDPIDPRAHGDDDTMDAVQEEDCKEITGPVSRFEPRAPAGVLNEDHPLLERFQQSLRTHLLKVQAQLVEEISEMDHNIKTKEKERESVGARLYDMQQQICQQNGLLEEYMQQIGEVTEKRQSYESHLESLKKDYGDKLSMNKEAKRAHNERLMELNGLQSLENNIQKWAHEIEDEVAAAKRVVSKDSRDQQAISEEKKRIDFLIFNLDAEVRKRERELDNIVSQIKEQDVVLNVLRKSLSDATADLEALQQEHKKLTQAWGEVIIGIGARDKVLCLGKDAYRAEKNNYKLLVSSIEGTKKEQEKQTKTTEKLSAFRNRMSDDLKNLKKQTDKENETIKGCDEKLVQLEAITHATEEDFAQAKREGNYIDVKLRAVIHEIEKISNKKLKLENEIIETAQEQITTDKANEYRMKKFREAQQFRRNLELTLAQTENQVSNVLLDLERFKGIILKLKEENEAITAKYNATFAESEELEREMKNVETEITIKAKKLEQLSAKLDKILNSGGNEPPSIDFKISILEKQIQDTESEINNLKAFWLGLQNRVIQLSEKRAAQMNEMQIARKQVMLIDQKSLKINLELDAAKGEGQELERKVATLQTRLDILGTRLYEKKMSHQNEEMECQYIHFELVEKLRKAEMSVLEAEEEIVQIMKEIECLKEVVLDRHREALSWETKYKMTEEIVRWKNNEKNDSEICNMRTEIRRMEVRYTQLKRAQEKLVQDLEFCVMHREKIFFSAMNRQKVEGSQSRSRSTIQHKLSEIKNKIKLTQNEISTAEKNFTEITGECERIGQEIKKLENEIESEKLQDSLVQAEIEEGMLMKHQNLESIVRKQHRAKRYRVLACSKAPPKCRSEAVIERDIAKQVEINDNLTDITQQLVNEFPDKKFFLSRIIQTLKDD